MGKKSKLDKSTILAECNGVLFVQLEAVMPFWVAVNDGISFTIFGDDKSKAFIQVDKAVEWLSKEIDSGSRGKIIKEQFDVLKRIQIGWQDAKSRGELNGHGKHFHVKMPPKEPPCRD